MKIVIVGNGMVGFKCCEKLTGRSPGRFQITVFGEETRPAYDRVHLSDYFSGKVEASLYLAPAEWYAGQGIQLHLGDPVCQINRQSKTVDSFKGKSVPYDLLILATGSAPFVPVIEGIEKKGVYLYRNLEDLDLIESRAAKSQKGAVIGGGLLGLEAAKALLDLGLREVSVIEYASRLMPRQLDEMGSQILMEKLKTLGLNILLGKNTVALEGDPGIRQLFPVQIPGPGPVDCLYPVLLPFQAGRPPLAGKTDSWCRS